MIKIINACQLIIYYKSKVLCSPPFDWSPRSLFILIKYLLKRSKTCFTKIITPIKSCKSHVFTSAICMFYVRKLSMFYRIIFFLYVLLVKYMGFVIFSIKP